MVERAIDWSVKNSFLIVVCTILLIGASIWAIKNTPLDALPDLSPPQVIVEVSWEGQSPNIIEDQLTFPLISTFMSIADIETVRGISSFENALIYIIFKDNIDLYWARSRVLEQISQVQNSLPSGASVTLGPDATGVGWVYKYALVSKTKSLQELRTLQDFYYKYALLGVDGVSEVATIGGFVKNYQVTLKQDKLLFYGLDTDDVIRAIRSSNNDSGGRVLLESGFERIVEANAYLKNEEDISNITIKREGELPIKVSNIADVEIVPANRRGMADLNGEGEVVGGIVVVRYGENSYGAIKRIKERIATLKSEDVDIVTVYDRSELIEKAISTLTRTLSEESIIVLLVVSAFLLHLRSALVIIITLPITVLFTFLLMKLFEIPSTIMSLGGIAIAIGAMVDASIVMVENAHKHLSSSIKDGEIIDTKKRAQIILKATKQVGRPIFFALMIIVVSFLPIFALTGQEGKLFTPLAYTKTFAMLVGAILSITLVPILMLWLIKGNIPNEQKNPINRFFIAIYDPLLRISLFGRYVVLALSIVSLGAMYYIYKEQKWEFMPMLNEQVFMYMPVTPYGIGIDAAKEYTQKSDKIIKSFPEVESVFGKAGRAQSATDPAPLSMIETFITFKPQEEWREGMSYEILQNELEDALQIRGLTNSWTYPIRGRIDMLLTGIRTPLGIKLYGNDMAEIQEIAKKIEHHLRGYDGTLSVFAERANSGYFLHIEVDESKLSHFGISKSTILDTISYGVGGKKISELIDGVERYPISVRYEDSSRDDIESIRNIPIKTALGVQRIGDFATIHYKESPSVLKSEKGLKVAFIYITPKDGVSAKEYKQSAKELLVDIQMPEGYFLEWAGESEYLDAAMERLKVIIPSVIVVILLLIFIALKDIASSLIVFFSLPFAILGGILYIDMLDFNLSIAVIVGFLALLGVASESAIVMIIYIEEAYKKYTKDGAITKAKLKEAIREGAVIRLRPKLMTVFSLLAGLMPIMYVDGVGSEVMQRVAAPMIGGMISSMILTLLIIPVLYYMVKSQKTIG